MWTLKQAIDKAKAEPNTDFSTDLRRRIENWSFDQELKDESIKLPFYSPKLTRPEMWTEAFKEIWLEAISEFWQWLRLTKEW